MKTNWYKIGVLFLALTAKSNAFAQAGLGPGAYCMPAYSNIPCNQPNPSNTAGNSINDFINDFNTTGATANITNNGSLCQTQVISGVSQNYFFKSCPTFLRVSPGQVITVNIRSGIIYDQGFAVYVDWNLNNVFAFPGEQVCATPGVPIANTWTAMNFTIPGAQAAGNYRMRARCAYFTTGTTIDPCALYSFGETEDYDIVVGGGVCAPLPIELVSFEATEKERGVEVFWITATETNSSHFTLEKSYDGVRYESPAQIPAAGNSTKEKLYVTQDNDAKKDGVIYYRLKEYDKGDKEAKFTKVITYYGKNVTPTFDLFPNPANGDLKLNMPEVMAGKAVTVEVYNTNGNRVLSSDVVIDAMNSPVQLNISNLDNGSYYVKVSDNTGTEMKKMLIKQ